MGREGGREGEEEGREGGREGERENDINVCCTSQQIFHYLALGKMGISVE